MYDLGRGDGFVQSSITLGRANILDVHGGGKRRSAMRYSAHHYGQMCRHGWGYHFTAASRDDGFPPEPP
jgi:hypothetical protein